MSEESGDKSTAGITTPLGSLNFSGKRMAEFISVLLLCMFGVLSYAFYTHNKDSDSNAKQLTEAIKDLASANLLQVKEQRVMNCLLTLPQNDRQTQLANCERIAR